MSYSLQVTGGQRGPANDVVQHLCSGSKCAKGVLPDRLSPVLAVLAVLLEFKKVTKCEGPFKGLASRVLL